jgi:hypothetical protein
MQLVPLCGPPVVARHQAIAVRRFTDLRDEDPFDLMERVNLAAGNPIWPPPMATRALENQIAAAEHEAQEE